MSMTYIELEKKLEEKQRLLEEAVEELLEERTLAAFWRRAAEQALRLWDRAQDEVEELQAAVADSKPREH